MLHKIKSGCKDAAKLCDGFKHYAIISIQCIYA
jgi:hypothetical protein